MPSLRRREFFAGALGTLALPARAKTATARGAETVITGARIVDAGRLTLAPGFIDTHSHHDVGLGEHPAAPAAVRQGITTIVVNQDGFGFRPLDEVFSELRAKPATVNVAAFCGHNSIRSVAIQPR